MIAFQIHPLIVILILIGIIGYIAQYIGLCMVRGVKEARAGKPTFLLAIVFSGAFVWVSTLLLQLFGMEPRFISHGISLSSALGGLLFGMGAGFNGGCSVSTIGRLTRGELIMGFTVLGWLIGWIIEASALSSYQPSEYQVSSITRFVVLISISVILILISTLKQRHNLKVWLSMLSIGLIGGIVISYEPNWTPSGLLKDLSKSFGAPGNAAWPSYERYLQVLALLVGMITAATITRSYDLRVPSSLKVISRHLAAGILMGIGAAIAGGGNDSQLLLALPSLSIAGGVTVLSMVIGIYVTIRFLIRQ